MNVRVVALVAAAWYLLFALPTFFRVPEIEPDATVDSSYADSYRRLFGELRQLWREDPRSIKFLVAQAVFRDGLAGVFTFGAILAVTVPSALCATIAILSWKPRGKQISPASADAVLA